MIEATLEATYRPITPVDLQLTLGPLVRGPGDPTSRVRPGEAWRASWHSTGPATLRIMHAGDRYRAQAWGPGREEALEALPDLLGAGDDPDAFRPADQLLRALHARFSGLRMTRTGRILEPLIPAVTEQKVTSIEARRGYRALVLRYGTPAPGPGGLRLPPSATALAALPYHAFHPLGIEQRRADTIRRAAATPRLEDAALLGASEARRHLRTLPGVGAWTAAEVTRLSHGDPDALSVGDFHVPHLVAWTLAGEPRGTDERMLELLERYPGQRGRVVRLLELSRLAPPRFGPRLAPRRIAHI